MSGWLNRLFGSAGEKAAIRYLKQQGFRVVIQNYENRAGEIDVIALDGQTIVFVEVKTRRNDSKGNPLDAVDHTKQQQILRAAQLYLKETDLFQQSVRYDVIGLLWPENDKTPQIEHIRSAFPD